MCQPLFIRKYNQFDFHDDAVHFVGDRNSRHHIKKKKRVVFAQYIQKMEGISLDDYTKQEIKSAWHSEKEISQVSAECLAMREQTSSSMYAEEQKESETMRRLEPHTSIGSALRSSSRHTSINWLLSEQREKGIIDVEPLSEGYRNTTSSCRMWAQVVGTRDQREAEAGCRRGHKVSYNSAVKYRSGCSNLRL